MVQSTNYQNVGEKPSEQEVKEKPGQVRVNVDVSAISIRVNLLFHDETAIQGVIEVTD